MGFPGVLKKPDSFAVLFLWVLYYKWVAICPKIIFFMLTCVGLTIVTHGRSERFTKLDEDGDYNFQKKAWAAFFFLQLPLLKAGQNMACLHFLGSSIL